MAKVTAELVGKLRKYSGLSKADCRELLGLAEGDWGTAKFMADTTNAVLASAEAQRPGPKRRMNDPVFGRMVWDYRWEGRAAAVTPGKKVRVSVESADGAGPDERQREAYQSFLRVEKKLAPAVRTAHLRHYRKLRRVWGRTEGAAFVAEVVPPVRSAGEVERKLSGATVHVPKQPRRGWEVWLRWECEWDVEHGHEVRVRDGKVRRVGQQGG